VLAGLVEAGGGLLLAAGLFSPLAAAMIISVMRVTTVTIHLAKGFFVQNGGCEYNLALAAGALALAYPGPGALSLDAALGSPGLAPRGV
jgi:putative oxidoreductase